MNFKKRGSLLVLTLMLGGLIIGCSKEEKVTLDIETIKSNSPTMLHEEVADEILAREDMTEVYKEHSNVVSYSDYKPSENYTDFIKTLTEEQKLTFEKYANVQGVNIRMIEKEGNKEYMNELITSEVNTLLNHMYFLPNDYENNRVGTEKFKSLNVEKTMNDYLKNNNIKITEVSQVKGIDIDYSSLPFKATINYTLKGSVNDQEFEKEIKQDLYVSPEDSEVLEGVDPFDITLSIDALVTVQ